MVEATNILCRSLRSFLSQRYKRYLYILWTSIELDILRRSNRRSVGGNYRSVTHIWILPQTVLPGSFLRLSDRVATLPHPSTFTDPIGYPQAFMPGFYGAFDNMLCGMAGCP